VRQARRKMRVIEEKEYFNTREAPTRVIQVELATNETIGFGYNFGGAIEIVML